MCLNIHNYQAELFTPADEVKAIQGLNLTKEGGTLTLWMITVI